MKKIISVFFLLSLWGLSTKAQCGFALATDHFCDYSKISAIGGGSGTYTWEGPGITAGQGTNAIIVNVTGTYKVTANGCTATIYVNVFFSPTATTSSMPTNCNGSGGTATVSINGGTSPYLINWSNGATTATIDHLPAGSYSVTVTDYHDCQAISTVVVNGSNPVALGFDTYCDYTLITAHGCLNCTYQWLGPGILSGQGTNTITVNVSGIYSVTVNGCISSIQVPVFFSPVVNLTTMNPDCNGANGSATATVTSGTAPFMYLWSNGATTATINNLSSGTYSVTVTDQHDCKVTGSVELFGNVSSDSTFVSKDTCNILLDGTRTVTGDSCIGVVITDWHWIPAFDSTTVRDTCVAGLQPKIDTVSISGCDGILRTEWQLLPLPPIQVSRDTCDSSFDGLQTIATLPGSSGYCDTTVLISWHWTPAFDSLVIRDTCLTGIAIKIDTVSISGCDGILRTVWNFVPNRIDSVFFSCNGLTGDTLISVTNFLGCVTLITLHRFNYTKATGSEILKVCSNKFPFIWNGLTISSAGSYTATLQGVSFHGCDSTINLMVTAITEVTATQTVKVCSGSSYSFQGNNFPKGEYEFLATSFLGCDSIFLLKIEEFQFVDTTFIAETTCDTSKVGRVIAILQSFTGCDSVVVQTTVLGSDCITVLGECVYKVFPNPTHGPLTVFWGGRDDVGIIAMIEIFSQLGVLIEKRIVDPSRIVEEVFDLGGMKSGIFFVKFVVPGYGFKLCRGFKITE